LLLPAWTTAVADAACEADAALLLSQEPYYNCSTDQQLLLAKHAALSV
jgi:hypothetical protein